MNRISLFILIGAVSSVGSLLAGYLSWRYNLRCNTSRGSAAVSKGRRGDRLALRLSSVPLIAGVTLGIGSIAIALQALLPGDRFYQSAMAFQVLGATVVGILLIWSVDFLAPPLPAGRLRRWGALLLAEILASMLAVSAGVRFPILGGVGTKVFELGYWAGPLTVLWLILAVNLVKLLDGIHGAASLVLILASVAILAARLNSNEYFLLAFSLAVAGAAFGAFRFNVSANRLPLRGAGTAVAGFLFAILTVLARQKTIAAFALISPLVLIFILAAGAMLGFLEKNLLLKQRSHDD